MSLLQRSLTGAVMIAVIMLLRALTVHRMPKRTFPVLWGAALLRLLLPFSLPSAFSVYTLLRPRTSAAAPQLPTALFRVVPSGQAETASAAALQPVAASARVPVWGIVWAVGMLLCTAAFAMAYAKCCREFRMSLPVENAAARHWLQTHPLRRAVSIRQSDRVASPLTFGVWRPVILLPKRTDWENETALRYVLEHEFVHIQRFDTVYKLLLVAAVCIHWFNPLVWVMYAFANRDIELSCDEAVVRRFGRDARASYAGVLIDMEETKSGLEPLCSHFSKNAIEERIIAIMKLKKTTVLSFAAAAVLVAGTVTVFATSAKTEPVGEMPAVDAGTAQPAESGMEALSTGKQAELSDEYLSAGLSDQKGVWYYQGQPVAGLYDDNCGIYMDAAVENGRYVHAERQAETGALTLTVISEKQFRQLVDRHMNLMPTETLAEDSSMMSYIDPDDGKTYYSFDDGKTFQPLTDAELEELYPTPDNEWWTYDDFKAWMENEKVQLQSIIGDTYEVGGKEYVWTQEKVDEIIAWYQTMLEDMENGIRYSKSVDGQEDVLVSYGPMDKTVDTSSDAKEQYLKMDNGEEKASDPHEADAEMLAAVQPYYKELAGQGSMTQGEAPESASYYTAD